MIKLYPLLTLLKEEKDYNTILPNSTIYKNPPYFSIELGDPSLVPLGEEFLGSIKHLRLRNTAGNILEDIGVKYLPSKLEKFEYRGDIKDVYSSLKLPKYIDAFVFEKSLELEELRLLEKILRNNNTKIGTIFTLNIEFDRKYSSKGMSMPYYIDPDDIEDDSEREKWIEYQTYLEENSEISRNINL